MAQLSPLIREAKRQAEKLSRYVIEPIGCRWVVIYVYHHAGEKAERVFLNQQDAEDYLFKKLPPIESER